MRKRERIKNSPNLTERAVKKFDEADSELNEFLEENDDFASTLRRLVEERNDALKQVETALKSSLSDSDASKLHVGRFGVIKKGPTYKWDPSILKSVLDRKTFRRCTEEKITYVVNVDELEHLIELGEVRADSVSKAKVPSKQVLSMVPGCPKLISI